MNSPIVFCANSVPAERKAENTLPENTLPVLSFQGDKTIFNKKAVAFPGFSEKSIAEKLSGAKAFLASNPDLNDKKVYQQLVSYQSEVVGCRTGLEKVRKGITAIYRAVTDYTNKKAKEMLVEQAILEAEIKELRNTHDAEVERLQQEAAEKERVRVQDIEDRIEEIQDLPAKMIGSSSSEIEAAIQTLSYQSDNFLEFKDAGTTVKEKALNLLTELYKTKVAEERQNEEKEKAEQARKKKEAADRVELDRRLKGLEIQQESAIIKESIADFVLESPERIEEYIKTLQDKYIPCGDEREVAAVSAVSILRALIAPAKQREAVAKQAAEQEAERKRLADEKEAEDRRKAQAEADRVAEEAKAKQDAIDLELYKDACELARTSLACEIGNETSSKWVSNWSGAAITIGLGETDLLNRVDMFISQQKIAFEAHEKARGEAEARKAEDMGQTVADIMDYGDWEPEDAELLVEAIVNGVISHVTWSNEE